MSTYYTEGIILKHRDFGEADKVITIYTKEYGKIEALAKGCRKIASKLSGSLEPFFYVSLMLARGRNMDKIASSEVRENFFQLREDLSKINLASYTVDLLDRLTKVHHKDTGIFNLLKQTLLFLKNKDKLEDESARKIKLFFAWRLLSLLGFQPAIFDCASCHNRISPEKIFFSFKKGGLVCQSCVSPLAMKDKSLISVNAIKILRAILHKDLKYLILIKVSSNLLNELAAITKQFLQYVSEEKIPSG